MNEQQIAFQGEVQLLSWGDTSTRGRTLTLQLDEEHQEHPFKHAREKKGKTAGQRYAVVFVQIGDDERPVEKTCSQMAWLLCRDPTFQWWLNERSFSTVNDEDSARAYVMEGLQIQSRSEIDKSPSVRNAWLTMFYNPWTAYQSALAQKALP